MNRTTLRTALLCLAAAILTLRAYADVVETNNGARLVGEIEKIAEGHIIMKTAYADVITIKQSDVTSITTDQPISVRLESGTVLEGTLTSQNGEVQISGADGRLTTSVPRIAAIWPAGAKDPRIAALERSWAYEAAVDIAGKSGNSEQLGTQVSGRATLKTDRDTLQFYTAYNRQVTDDVKAADEFKAGVDYANNFSGKRSWYVRTEGGFDRVKDIDLYNVSAVGLGYDFIKEPNHTLTGRAGISYRYEGYGNPASEDVSSAGLDLGLNHEWTFTNSRIINRLSIVPTFDDFGNFRLTHESFYEIPLSIPAWKLRIGISNDYNSEPGFGVEELDTSYFTRLVLTWK